MAILLKKKRIGIIIDSVDGIYQERIMRSIVKQTKNQNIDLFFICSLGVVDIAGEFEVHQGALALANTPFLDGLILVLGSFTNYFSKEWINNLIDSFDTKVKVAVGYDYENCQGVLFDNFASIEKVMTHLIEENDCKTIGYISGPRENEDAIARYKGYKLVLNDHSIAINKQFYFEGFFMEYTGTLAIKEMIKNSYKIPDAIVCASDEIAIGAVTELLANSIAVPYGVKVTGFDNITASAAFEVPITTVEQPIEVMVNKALMYLEQVFFDKEITAIESISGDLIRRESTREVKEKDTVRLGSLREENFLDETIIGPLIRFEEELVDNTDRLRDAFFKDFDVHENGIMIFEKMLKGLIFDVKTADSKGMFMSQVKELSSVLVYKMPYSLFNLRYNELKQFISDLVFNSQLFYRIQEVMFDSALAVNNHFYSLESAMKHKVKDTYIMSRSFVNLVDKAETLDEYFELVLENVHTHNFSEFYICLFDEPIYGDLSSKLKLSKKAKLMVGVHNNDIYDQEEFETATLLPEKVYNNYETKRLVLMDLIRDNIHYGYLLTKLDVDETHYIETIRLSISQAIHRFKG